MRYKIKVHNKHHLKAIKYALEELGYECVKYAKEGFYASVVFGQKSQYYIPCNNATDEKLIHIDDLYVDPEKYRCQFALPTNTPLPFPEYKPPKDDIYIVWYNTNVTGTNTWIDGEWNIKPDKWREVKKFMIIDWNEKPEQCQ